MSDELRAKVQELIDSTINPAVAGHGGFIELLDVKDNKVYLDVQETAVSQKAVEEFRKRHRQCHLEY